MKKPNIKINKPSIKKETVQTLKDYTLFAYITLTVLGIYSAIIFYAGTQYASAQTSPVVHISTPAPSPKK